MLTQNLRLQKPLEDFIDYWETLNARSVSLFCGMFAQDAAFEDPYVQARGQDQITQLLQARIRFFPKIIVQDFAWGRTQGTAFTRWFADNLEGVSAVTFMPDGQIANVNEFWGTHNTRHFKDYARK